MQANIQCDICGKVTKVNLPAKYCKFKVSCKCGNKMRFDYSSAGLTPLPPEATQQLPRRPLAPQPPDIGTFICGEQHQVKCPLCGGATVVKLSKSGPQDVKCTACGGTLKAKGTGTMIHQVKELNTIPGIIRVRKSGLAKMFGSGKRMLLRPGANIIGRYDSIETSDFVLTDKSVSRRSLNIEVCFDALMGYTFKLTVLKAANPVYHNGHELKINEAIQIKFNDTIKVGKTILELVPNQI